MGEMRGKKHTCAIAEFVKNAFLSARSHMLDRLCGLVVRVSSYRYRGPGFDPRRYQIF